MPIDVLLQATRDVNLPIELRLAAAVTMAGRNNPYLERLTLGGDEPLGVVRGSSLLRPKPGAVPFRRPAGWGDDGR